MIITFLLFYTILIIKGESQINCAFANEDQCGVGICAGYRYINNKCE